MKSNQVTEKKPKLPFIVRKVFVFSSQLGKYYFQVLRDKVNPPYKRYAKQTGLRGYKQSNRIHYR